MNKTMLISLFMLFCGTIIQAQVKIGGNSNPAKGALLDLNGTYKGGLLLPNVEITNLSEIPSEFTDKRNLTPAELTGMMVWSTGTAYPGLYIWDGALWQSLMCNEKVSPCKGPAPAPTAINIPAGPFANGETFEVSCTAIEDGTTFYIWTAPTGLSIIAGQGTKTISVLSASGTFDKNKFTVFAVNSCGASTTFTGGTGHIVVSPESLSPGAGSFAGRTSFDVALSNSGGECGDISARKAESLSAYGTPTDFTGMATSNQTYTFTPSGDVSNVRFYYIEAESYLGQIIESISGGNSNNNIASGTPITCDIVYKSDLNDKASGKTTAEALTVTIYAVYNDNAAGTGTDKTIKLVTTIKDCVICGAFTESGTWLNFMCYNLGADPTLTTPNQQKASAASNTWGNYYQWGKSNSGFTTDGYADNVAWGDGSTKTSNDPCPADWRVPSTIQWKSIFADKVEDNKQYAWSDSKANTWTWYGSTTTIGAQIGNFLFLPAAGYLLETDGSFYDGGPGSYYWSRASYSNSSAWRLSFYRTYVRYTYALKTAAFSIRCIEDIDQ